MKKRRKPRQLIPDPNDPFEADEEAEHELADWMIAPDGKG